MSNRKEEPPAKMKLSDQVGRGGLSPAGDEVAVMFTDLGWL